MFHTPHQFDRSRILSHSRSRCGISINGGLTLLENCLTNVPWLIFCELMLLLWCRGLQVPGSPCPCEWPTGLFALGWHYVVFSPQ